MRIRKQRPPEGTGLPEMLAISGVRKAFGEHVVLDDVSLQLKKGDIALLVGANGCGKSTLLRCVA